MASGSSWRRSPASRSDEIARQLAISERDVVVTLIVSNQLNREIAAHGLAMVTVDSGSAAEAYVRVTKGKILAQKDELCRVTTSRCVAFRCKLSSMQNLVRMRPVLPLACALLLAGCGTATLTARGHSTPEVRGANAGRTATPSTSPLPTLSAPTPEPSPTPTVPQPSPTPIPPGTASLTYSGVLSGQLLNAVSSCQPYPNDESTITVSGSLSGTQYVLYIQSYDGQTGVWQVLTGQAGGGTGMIGQGYAVTETYPATVIGVTQIDWAQGATLDVQLTSGPGQTPAGDIEVQGTVTCG